MKNPYCAIENRQWMAILQISIKQCKFQQKRTVIEKLYSSFTGVLQPKIILYSGCKNNSLSFSSHSLQIIAAQGLDWMDLSSVSINEEYLHAQPDEVKARWASLV
ncbi:Hypothetical_protein [Hexamita inflata]|uniref:Hypothetical_protein n=1 Tax=Hexamita inflata TaxID=28002 RepID=A0AA86TNS6_9EUKA|nr:Hypothetical protein HINF_LOCUS11729 [Hexamita inflata]